jgi:hypothetical protein
MVYLDGDERGDDLFLSYVLVLSLILRVDKNGLLMQSMQPGPILPVAAAAVLTQ